MILKLLFMSLHLIGIQSLTCCDRLQSEHSVGKRYDFIIIGGGTAGCVLAARLSEVKSWRILLIEAGTSPKAINKIPALAAVLQQTEADYNYRIEPQRNCCSLLVNQTIRWPAGKILGGSSEINYMINTKANKNDYDWIKSKNNQWSWEKMAPYYKKARHFQSKSKGTQMNKPFISNTTKVFLDGAVKAGYKHGNYNGGSQYSFSPIQAFIKNGTRDSTLRSYLELASSRKKLHILTEATVVKVIIELRTKRIVGVKLWKNGKKIRIKVNKEVILSAGVVGTTKLMLLSGIGPINELKNLNVTTVHDLPVGRNIMDHISYFGMNFLTNINPSTMKPSIFNLAHWHGKEKYYTSLAGFESLGFLKLDKKAQKPDIELLASNFLLNEIMSKITNVKGEIYEKFYKLVKDKVSLSIFPILLHPKSRGYIKLRSKNPMADPIINPQYLSAEEDVDKLTKAVQIIQKIMSPTNANAALYPVPICNICQYHTYAYWKCAVRKLLMSFGDYMGGCKLGQDLDPDAVVNEQLLVKGFSSLRVVDASIIPKSISGHIANTVIVIAEKAAYMIKIKYRKRCGKPCK